MEFQEWWTAYADAAAREAGQSDDAPRPATADVVSALYYAHKETLPLATVDGVTFYSRLDKRYDRQELPAWIVDAVETYRQRCWALWGAAFQLPAEPETGFHARLSTYIRNDSEKDGDPDQEAQPASDKMHDLEGTSVTPDGYSSAHPTVFPSGPGFPPDSPIRLSDRLADGKTVIHMLFLGLMPAFPDANHDADIINRLIAGFEAVHTIWHSVKAQDAGASLKHPLTPLIEGYLSRPEIIRPDVDKNGRAHTNGIIPHGLLPNQPATLPAQLALIPATNKGRLTEIGRIEPAEGKLPLFAELMTDNDLPVTPLILADAAGFRGLKPGRGARYDKRLLVFGLLAMPLNQRRPGGCYEWRPTLREIRDLLWPARNLRGKTLSSYRPSVHASGLLSALQAINLAEVGLPDGDTWRPMRVWRNPNLANLDRQAIIEIRLPGASDRGPQVDKSALAAAGVISDPAFDLELGLAYLWDDAKARNGGRRIYATRPEVLRNAEGYIVDAAGQVVTERGGPIKRWDHRRAVGTGRQERHPQADKVQVLTREGRHRMAYGVREGIDTGTQTRERNAADGLLKRLEAAGRIVIERNAIDSRTDQAGWRILEAWPGE